MLFKYVLNSDSDMNYHIWNIGNYMNYDVSNNDNDVK